ADVDRAVRIAPPPTAAMRTQTTILPMRPSIARRSEATASTAAHAVRTGCDTVSSPETAATPDGPVAAPGASAPHDRVARIQRIPASARSATTLLPLVTGALPRGREAGPAVSAACAR